VSATWNTANFATLQDTYRRRRPWVAFLFAVPIALLGGLIGLGGAEFRLPVLRGPLGYLAKEAVPLNLAVSMVTLVVSLLTRARTLSLVSIDPLVPLIFSLIIGAMVAAFLGTSYVKRLSEEALERIILVLLVGVGSALVIEGFLPESSLGVVPSILVWVVATGFLFGLAIGTFSSVLGVAGGELILPTLIFAYGVGVKTAGTASLMVSLPTVAVGLFRYARQGAFGRRSVFGETIIPMGVGSIIGALVGGVLVGLLPSQILKVGLGVILIVSAVRIFRGGTHKAGGVPRQGQ
jgi:uncharacterized membrane protein YfcA